MQRAHPVIFERLPVPVVDLAQALGLRVQRRAELRQRARLEFFADKNAEPATIAVQVGLENNVSRFAVAHEIGHAVLLKKYPDAAKEWDIDRREEFANTFATELLASPEIRREMATTFRNLSDPVSLLRLASRMGFSLHGLLTLASRERSWVGALDKIWLRVKYVENASTHRDPKLRIVTAHYDPERFFVARNQSLARFAGGDDMWLSCMRLGSVVHHNTKVAISLRRPAPARPKFVSKELPAKLSALRLQPSELDAGAYLIVLVELDIGSREEIDVN
jgi:hypothetical protein